MPEIEIDPALVEAWATIWNTYDLSMVERLFIDDERVTYFSSEKRGLIKGIEALLRHHEEFGFVRGGKEQPNTLWLEDTQIEAYGDAVIVKADWCFRRNGSEKAQRGPVTFVYVPSGDVHRIAHAHFSNY